LDDAKVSAIETSSSFYWSCKTHVQLACYLEQICHTVIEMGCAGVEAAKLEATLRKTFPEGSLMTLVMTTVTPN
jgi:hypothetical protein